MVTIKKNVKKNLQTSDIQPLQFCGHFLCTLCVDTFGGHILWTLFEDYFVDAFCELIISVSNTHYTGVGWMFTRTS